MKNIAIIAIKVGLETGFYRALTGFLQGRIFSKGDLPEVVPPGSTIALYADDCKCSRIIDTVGDLFQQDLDNLHLLINTYHGTHTLILLYPRPAEWLGIIKRTCQGLDELTTLRTLYCSLVRSILQYC